MSISLKQLAEGDFHNVIQQLATLDTVLDYSSFYTDYQVNWQLQRKMTPQDVYYFWSANMMTSFSWAKTISEFSILFQGDQQVLFERNYALFCWLPVVYKCYHNQQQNEGFSLGNGAYIPVNEEDYSHLPSNWKKIYCKVAYRLVHEVALQMKRIQLTYEEYLLVKLIALFTYHQLLSPDGVRVCEEISKLLCRTTMRFRGEKSADFLREIVSILKSLADIGKMETDDLPDLLLSKKDWSPPDVIN